LFGLDWASASQQIIGLIRERRGLDITGLHFDFFHPDQAGHIRPKSAVVTLGGLEQTGDRFSQFLDYLLAERPAICVHVEPIYELYDQALLFDYLGAEYSRKRSYLCGYLDAIRRLEAEKSAQVVHVGKLLGSMYHDGWSLVVWKPMR
jgi:hypothetical protein